MDNQLSFNDSEKTCMHMAQDGNLACIFNAFDNANIQGKNIKIALELDLLLMNRERIFMQVHTFADS